VALESILGRPAVYVGSLSRGVEGFFFLKSGGGKKKRAKKYIQRCAVFRQFPSFFYILLFYIFSVQNSPIISCSYKLKCEKKDIKCEKKDIKCEKKDIKCEKKISLHI